MNKLIKICSISFIAYIVGLLIFSPRYYTWLTLREEHLGVVYPEVFRAIFVLEQLKDPLVLITNPGNQVLNWRLLMPVIGHYLHLPEIMFMILPHVGVLLVLGLIVHIVKEQYTSLLASLLMITTSFFFSSTGYLLNFDAWVLFGMLVVVFIKNKWALMWTGLLVPWIDERFFLALPLVVALRLVYLKENFSWNKELLLLIGTFILYLSIRVIAILVGADQSSSGYLGGRIAENFVSISAVFEGVWSGLRFVWIFVLALPILIYYEQKKKSAILILLIILGTIILQVGIAQDVSRSMYVCIPAFLMTIILMERHHLKRMNWILGAVLLFNIITPAQHVIIGNGAVHRFPINHIGEELKNIKIAKEKLIR